MTERMLKDRKELLRYLMYVSKHCQQSLNYLLSDVSISCREWLILDILINCNDVLSLKQISEKLGESKTNVLKTLSKIENKKLVVRRHFGKSRRIKRIDVTENGKALYDNHISLVDGFMLGVAQHLVQPELELVIRALHKLKGQLCFRIPNA